MSVLTESDARYPPRKTSGAGIALSCRFPQCSSFRNLSPPTGREPSSLPTGCVPLQPCGGLKTLRPRGTKQNREESLRGVWGFLTGTGPLTARDCVIRQTRSIRIPIRIAFHIFSANYLVLSTSGLLTNTHQPRYPEPQTRTIRQSSIPNFDLAPPAGLPGRRKGLKNAYFASRMFSGGSAVCLADLVDLGRSRNSVKTEDLITPLV
jgi:hypothetical protein